MTRDEARKIYIGKGQLVILSNGMYSDYKHHGVYRALVDIDKSTMELITAEINACTEWRFPREVYVVEAMIAKSIVERLPYTELYLGAYGDIDIEVRGGNHGES